MFKIVLCIVFFICNLVFLDGNVVKMFIFFNEDVDIWMVNRKIENVGVNILVCFFVFEMKMCCNVIFFKIYFLVGWSLLMWFRLN